MSKNLRSFLRDVEAAGRMWRVGREVDPRANLAALADESDRTIMFENLKGYPGWSVVANLSGSRELEMVTFGVERREDCIRAMAAALDRGPQPHERVATSPAQEVVWEGEDANLLRLPVVQHSELDGGPYIGSGIGVVVDPDTGLHNTTWPRLQIADGRTCPFLVFSPHVGRIHAKYARAGRPMPMAISIGHHPAVDIACSFSLHHPLSGELDYAANILGEPLQFVKCGSIDVDVPAETEIIIEGEVPPNVVQDEGPFGNYLGTYAAGPLAKDGVQKSIVLEIKRVTTRRNPVFRHLQATVWTEHQRLCMLPIEGSLFIALAEMGIDVHDIYIPSWGGCGMTIIQMTPRGPGEAKAALLKALLWENTSLGFMSHVALAVNRDVDVYDARDVVWAMAARANWGEPVQQVFGTPASPINPRGQKLKGMPYRLSGKVMIDATVLPPRDDAEWWDQARAWPLGKGSVRLADFVEGYAGPSAQVRNVDHEQMLALKPGEFRPAVGRRR